MAVQERRRSGDRRRHARGGRRPDDRSGHAPLVFVVTSDAELLASWEQQLLARNFAVVACQGAGAARDAFRALRPDVIVAAGADWDALHERLPHGRLGGPVPVVELPPSEEIEPLLVKIRRALQGALV
jgi:hypothetical protein